VKRLTERNGAQITYIGKHTKYPGLDGPGSMKVAAQRECMELLAAYEDTGLTPEQIKKLLQDNLLKN
jgi:hypothetical protein